MNGSPGLKYLSGKICARIIAATPSINEKIKSPKMNFAKGVFTIIFS